MPTARIGQRLIDAIRKNPPKVRVDYYDSDISGFHLRASGSGAITYFVKYRNGAGVQKRLRLGSSSALTVAQARDLAKLRLSEVTQGADPAAARQAARRDPGVQTLRQFVEGPYREVWLSQRKSGNEVYKRPMVVFAEFLDKPLTDLKLGELERWRGTRREKGRKPATVNRDITSLKSAQNRACDWGYIEKTPSPN